MLARGRTRSCLITTCSDPSLMEKQRKAPCDIALMDLEDGVAPSEKGRARHRAVAALSEWDYGPRERWVRINHVDSTDGFKDLMVLAAARPDVIVPSKVRSAREIIAVDYLLQRREEELGLAMGTIKVAPMIETGPALENLREVLSASPRVVGLHLGVEDLSVDLGIVRTDSSFELEHIKSRVVVTAHTLGIYAYDVASAKIHEEDDLYTEARRAYHLGFDGKAAISPSQIPTIYQAFAPTEQEVERAKLIVEASRRAAKEDLSVYSVDGRMVDAPFVEQAISVLERSGVKTDAGTEVASSSA